MAVQATARDLAGGRWPEPGGDVGRLGRSLHAHGFLRLFHPQYRKIGQYQWHGQRPAGQRRDVRRFEFLHPVCRGGLQGGKSPAGCRCAHAQYRNRLQHGRCGAAQNQGGSLCGNGPLISVFKVSNNNVPLPNPEANIYPLYLHPDYHLKRRWRELKTAFLTRHLDYFLLTLDTAEKDYGFCPKASGSGSGPGNSWKKPEKNY